MSTVPAASPATCALVRSVVFQKIGVKKNKTLVSAATIGPTSR